MPPAVTYVEDRAYHMTIGLTCTRDVVYFNLSLSSVAEKQIDFLLLKYTRAGDALLWHTVPIRGNRNSISNPKSVALQNQGVHVN